ncbi:MAG: 23S rRNA (uracil(1939)-C(5))-methyltransferase RlmD [Burkholderiales bacterium]|nr:23S rRNA (uracil(1939)-C(5))-methyltransferase RlmD [Burkholderiales bacterium]
MERLNIQALDTGGRGVARDASGKVVFVEGALAGETVEVEPVRARRRFSLARVRAVLAAAAGRREPPCPHFARCGGCTLQHADARTQMAAKQRWLEDALERIGRVRPETMLPIVYGAEWGYRRRARLAVRLVEKKGGVLVGFHERASSYIAELRSCAVLAPPVSSLIVPLRELVGGLAARARLPQIEVAVGDAAVALVFRHLDPLEGQDLEALRRFADAHGVAVWLQPGGPETARPLHPADPDPLYYDLPEYGVRIRFAPTDFTQVNASVNRVLVSRAVRLLDPKPGERVADLYCGLGNFALPLARAGAAVLGLDANAALVARARENARANGLVAQFEIADLARPALARFGPFEKLVLDPPREGAIAVANALPDAWPRRIVYVSCDPATLARDANVLVNVKGFRLVAAGVVNMFPHTAHVESVCLFERD